MRTPRELKRGRQTIVCSFLTVVFVASAVYAQAPRPRPSQPAPSNRGGASRGATLVVETDLACALSIDGEARGNLEASGSTKVVLQRGEHIVRCVSSEDPELIWRRSVEVTGEESRAAVIELKPLKDVKEKDAAAKREQERAAAKANAESEARARVETQAAQEEERRQNWIRRLEGTWRAPASTGTATTGEPWQDAGTLLVLRRSGDGLAGTIRTDVTFQSGRGGLSREETVVELSIDVSGPTPVATLVRGQYFLRNNLLPNARFVLTDFRVEAGATGIFVAVEYGNGASYTRNLQR